MTTGETIFNSLFKDESLTKSEYNIVITKRLFQDSASIKILFIPVSHTPTNSPVYLK